MWSLHADVIEYMITAKMDLAGLLCFRLCSSKSERLSRRALAAALLKAPSPLFKLLSFGELFCDERLGTRRSAKDAIRFFACAAMASEPLLDDAPKGLATLFSTNESASPDAIDSDLLELTEGRTFNWVQGREDLMSTKWYYIHLRGVIRHSRGTYYEGQMLRKASFYFAYALYRVSLCSHELHKYQRALRFLSLLVGEVEHLEQKMRDAVLRLIGLCLLELGWRTVDDAPRRKALLERSIAAYNKAPGALSSYNVACALCGLDRVDEAKHTLASAFGRVGLPRKAHALADEQLVSIRAWIESCYPEDVVSLVPDAQLSLSVAAFSKMSLEPPSKSQIRVMGYD